MVSERTMRRLRRGEYSTQDEIGLHHLRAPGMRKPCSSSSSARRGPARASACAIIHGKGLRSEGAPVLKMLVDRVLRLRGDVLPSPPRRRRRAAAGAVLVLLDTR
jgi:DNA-nicking Smr family endonuclease